MGQAPDEARSTLLDHPILVVDDDAANLTVFEGMFGDEFTLRLARSGREALDVLGHERVSVLVTDQRMPELSGVDLCERVRNEQPHVRRVLITGYADQHTAVDAINRGGVHSFIIKPWNADQLRGVLRDAVHRVQLEQLVGSLRADVVEKERLLAISTMRERILHDLANVTSRLVVGCRTLESLAAEQPPATDWRERLASEAAALKEAVAHIMALHGERRVLSHSQQVSVQALDLDEVVRTTQMLCVPALLGVARLETNCRAGLAVMADRLSLTRVLMNLVTNARAAVEQNQTGRGRIQLAAVADGKHVQITVADNGPGVPGAVRKRLFSEVVTTRAARGGSGIGLLASRELARKMGGDLTLLDERPLGGAAFRLTLRRV